MADQEAVLAGPALVAVRAEVAVGPAAAEEVVVAAVEEGEEEVAGVEVVGVPAAARAVGADHPATTASSKARSSA